MDSGVVLDLETNSVGSFSPLLRGEGWDEGQQRGANLLLPLTPTLSPRKSGAREQTALVVALVP